MSESVYLALGTNLGDRVENAFITSEYGAELNNADGVQFENVHVEPVKGAALILKNVENFNAKNLSYKSGIEKPIQVCGASSSNVVINDVRY